MNHTIVKFLRIVADMIEQSSTESVVSGIRPEAETPEPQEAPRKKHRKPKPQRNKLAELVAERKSSEPPPSPCKACANGGHGRHKKDCARSKPKPDESEDGGEPKEFRCDDCMWRFKTKNLDDVKCSHCKSSNVWPVTEND